jgi:hypothetical protein
MKMFTQPTKKKTFTQLDVLTGLVTGYENVFETGYENIFVTGYVTGYIMAQVIKVVNEFSFLNRHLFRPVWPESAR